MNQRGRIFGCLLGILLAIFVPLVIVFIYTGQLDLIYTFLASRWHPDKRERKFARKVQRVFVEAMSESIREMHAERKKMRAPFEQAEKKLKKAIDEEDISALVRALEDPDLYVRLTASGTLARLGQRAREAVPALQRLLKDENELVRANAAHALGLIDPGARGAVVEGLTPVRGSERARTYPASPPVPITALVTQLREGSKKERVDALYELQRWKNRAEAVPYLVDLLKDKDADIRYHAARALGAMGEAAKPALLALVDSLRDENSSVASCAAEALGDIGPAASEVVPEMISARIHHPDKNVRISITGAIAKIKGEGTWKR